MAEMMELIRTLIKDKGHASGSGPQNKIAQHNPYAPNIHMAQTPLTQQIGGFQYSYALPPTQVNETGQSSGANAANPIEIPNLDDLIVREKIKWESMEQSENNKAQRKLDLIEEWLKAMEGSDVYGLVDTCKMSLVSDLVLPSKFKVPTFDKYDGTKCPSAHLYMYCKKMTGQ